jgi:RND family efflux transporter MFP subunit
MKFRVGFVAVLALVMAIVVAGCREAQPTAAVAPPPPEVLTSLPVVRQVTDYEDFPGRAEAVQSIDVKARVTGYLVSVRFREGSDVIGSQPITSLCASTLGLMAGVFNMGSIPVASSFYPGRGMGDLLFEIDNRQYQADLDRTEANVVQAEARLTRIETTFKKVAELRAGKSISDEEYSIALGDRGEAIGNLGMAKANRDMARLNFGWTKIYASISGRISRRLVDPGNVVKADETILTTIVSLNPIYGYFDLDERTTLRLQAMIRQGKIRWSENHGLPVLMGLSNEEGYPRSGTVDFTDNRLDSDTGTWRLRGLFPNPQQVIAPGMFVRIRLPLGEPYDALLVAEQALGTDQGQKFVYVVDNEGTVNYRRVKVGRLQDGLRVISDGLTKEDKVVVSGLQRVRQGVKANPKMIDMPSPRDKAKAEGEKASK